MKRHHHQWHHRQILEHHNQWHHHKRQLNIITNNIITNDNWTSSQQLQTNKQMKPSSHMTSSQRTVTPSSKLYNKYKETYNENDNNQTIIYNENDTMKINPPKQQSNQHLQWKWHNETENQSPKSMKVMCTKTNFCEISICIHYRIPVWECAMTYQLALAVKTFTTVTENYRKHVWERSMIYQLALAVKSVTTVTENYRIPTCVRTLHEVSTCTCSQSSHNSAWTLQDTHMCEDFPWHFSLYIQFKSSQWDPELHEFLPSPPIVNINWPVLPPDPM